MISYLELTYCRWVNVKRESGCDYQRRERRYRVSIPRTLATAHDRQRTLPNASFAALTLDISPRKTHTEAPRNSASPFLFRVAKYNSLIEVSTATSHTPSGSYWSKVSHLFHNYIRAFLPPLTVLGFPCRPITSRKEAWVVDNSHHPSASRPLSPGKVHWHAILGSAEVEFVLAIYLIDSTSSSWLNR